MAKARRRRSMTRTEKRQTAKVRKLMANPKRIGRPKRKTW